MFGNSSDINQTILRLAVLYGRRNENETKRFKNQPPHMGNMMTLNN